MDYDRAPMREEMQAVIARYRKRDKVEDVEIFITLIELLAGNILRQSEDQHEMILETAVMSLTKTVEASRRSKPRGALN